MAIKLIASYSKKVGLPGFSSVGLNLAVETELQNLGDVTRQSEQLYKLLQKSVDDRLQQSPGFIPPHAFGMEQDQNGEWACSPKQRELIEKIIAENKLDQTEIEQLAAGMFGLRLQQLNKLQASGFIDELFDRHGNGTRNGFRQRRSPEWNRCPEGGNSMMAVANPPAAPATAAEENQPRTIAELTQTVSASRLSTWQRCRLQFYFRYVAGIQKAPTPALHIGTVIHTVLQQWNLARWHKRQLNIEALKGIFSQAWAIWQDGEQIEWDGKEEKSRSAAWNVLQMYLRDTPIMADEKPEAVEVGVEADLSAHGLPTLVGVIDLVRSGGRIVDFKTSARTPDAKMLAHTTETQTSTYGILYREATGGKENGIELHHLIKTKKPKLVVNEFGPVSEAQITRLFHVIEAYVNALQRDDFVPSPGLQCGSCEFFQECRAWR